MTDPTTPTELPPLTEDQVALRLGVSRDWVRDHRGPEGGRWFYGQSRRVLWRQAAVDALLVDLGAEASTKPPQDDARVLVVTSARFSNRKVVEGHAEGAAEGTPRVVCWVPDARRFGAGQRILVRPYPGREGVFLFAGDPDRPELGPVLPRRPGRWP